jgi:hypothetical protein
MERAMKRILLKSGLVALLVASWTASAWAIKPFEVEFKKLYYKADSKDPKEKTLATAIDKISTEIESDEGVVKNACNVCHLKGKAKTKRNEFGEKLSDLLDKRDDKDNTTKIQASIKKTVEMKSSKGPTYAELLKAGKLPAE